MLGLPSLDLIGGIGKHCHFGFGTVPFHESTYDLSPLAGKTHSLERSIREPVPVPCFRKLAVENTVLNPLGWIHLAKIASPGGLAPIAEEIMTDLTQVRVRYQD